MDDGSTDGTARVAFSYARARGADAVRVLRLPRNRGKGAAVRAGAFVARGERLLMMDADGATRVADLDRLEAAVDGVVAAATKKDGAAGATVAAAAAPRTPPSSSPSPLPLAAALGSRAHLAPGVAATRAAHRNFLMRGFHLLVVAVAGPAVITALEAYDPDGSGQAVRHWFAWPGAALAALLLDHAARDTGD